MPLVSIIVPVYNTGAYLQECLDHLVGQTLEDIEIIVINDGSTDESEKIIQNYVRRYPHLYYYARENHGISYTRNQGIQLASGKYLMFVDSDDYLALDACEKLVEVARKSQAEVTVCDFYEFNTEDKKLNSLPDFTVTSLTESPSLLFDINSSPWNKLYLRSFIVENQIVFPENLKYEDTVFVLKALYLANKISKCQEALVYYRVREGSETMVMNERVFDIFPILDQVNTIFQSSKSETLRHYLTFFNINRLTVYNLQQVYQPNEETAQRFIQESFAYLDQHFPDWKHNRPFRQHNSWVKWILKRSPWLTKRVVSILRKRVKTS
ncbi:MAG TPA: glycosyltransferase [Candidatus Fimiplasma intestinipullorum]|uniref:Glycosyltransferase n=1 Tax=Candidatus Fimiplasma intestinipullorum TaxID=2840825 RepID=A0A9D1L0W7_9FIRM|nr:glycosyltransferase [Candidatus Fimiplasma intestinipullorum]